MKKWSVLLMLMLTAGLTACGSSDNKEKAADQAAEAVSEEAEEIPSIPVDENAVQITLSNEEILVNEEKISEDPESDVYKANDIIFYLKGQGIEYGAGSENDEHSQTEADAHTVVHITKPGTYELSGTLDAGQIFVDLGEGAKDDPEAVVNLILNNVDITCTVAPAVFFYNVYECSPAPENEEDATMEVDLTGAGANVQIADDSSNKIYGSYVAKIYESYELNEEGTKVTDSKKLHKYDGAFYSKMSMNVYGNTGKLAITAENEGMDTEMHLTIYGGTISIKSGNDGINVNEDNVSVFTMNNGTLNIQVTGETGEGDGIDSNGWLVINGGSVHSQACSESPDAGVDADQGIYINGGTIIAAGNMPAEIAEGKQTVYTFQITEPLEDGKKYQIRDAEENEVLKFSYKNKFTNLVVSAPELIQDGEYSLWFDGERIADGMRGAVGFGMGGMEPGGKMPDGEPPEMPDGKMPDGEAPQKPDGAMPDGEPPEMPDGEAPQKPDGKMPQGERKEPPAGGNGTELPDKKN